MNIQTLLAGPILRRTQCDRIAMWLATSKPVQWQITLISDQGAMQQHALGQHCCEMKVGEHFYVQLIDLPLSTHLPADTWIGYVLEYKLATQREWTDIVQEAAHLLYPGKTTLGFVIQSRIDSVLHGSCRKPHYARRDKSLAGDGLVRADQHLLDLSQTPTQWPTLLIMSGDQIYTDDVAGPMLVAIHRLLDQLNGPDEHLPGSPVQSSHELHKKHAHYYTRDQLLPKTSTSKNLRTVLFTGARKPVFTTDSAKNHLVTLAEVMAMYLLVWSPIPWQYSSMTIPSDLPTEFETRYQWQKEAIEQFVTGLARVQRVLAHIPTAMVFDDHDITDDWNLSADWESTAYAEPFSRRIIGNALIAYLLCQGWGNAPERFSHRTLKRCQLALQCPGTQTHEDLISELIDFRDWHYQWSTQPPLVVIDTRTRRWRSELNPTHPSGLMDWESLSELQQNLLGHSAVLLVSPAPIFGVKLIEGIQKVFTWFGRPLMVDAENWMTHPGAANTLLNLFRHGKTPHNFVILSGDVHYSFAYEVELRGKRESPKIWQITSSGFRNEFPRKLLDVLDRFNRWLYAPWSPLNWFTKRRKMQIVPRKPNQGSRGERLVNGSGVGLLRLDAQGAPIGIMQLLADGDTIEFRKRMEDEVH